MDVKERARQIGKEVGAVQTWHSDPCVGCEKNIQIIAAAIEQAVSEALEEAAKLVENFKVQPSECLNKQQQIAAALRAKAGERSGR